MIRKMFIVILAFALVACAPPQSTTQQPSATQPSPMGDWVLHMTQSGGFAGLHRSIEITSNGKMTVQDLRTDQTVTQDLSSGSLAILEGLISRSNFKQAAPTRSSNCADCFGYSLTLQTSDGEFTVELDDITLSNSGFAPLVSFLTNNMDATLK